ncbi:MAG: hypothetical protein IIB43_09605 [Candidatus Marinimicrobia bacterium]|nr:hypothetical protein [Candidatus Neomarinimicrobiota bacterium]
MGNLSYPTVGFSQFAESIYIGQLLGERQAARLAASVKVEASNRFSSGLPAMLEWGFVEAG